MQVFLISSISTYRHFRSVAERVVDSGDKIAFYYVRTSDDTYLRIAEDCSAQDYDLVCQEDGEEMSLASLSSPFRLPISGWRSIWAKILPFFFEGSKTFQIWTKHFKTQIFFTQRVYADLNPTVIYCCEDGVSSNLVSIAVARAMNIPVVDVPFGDATRQDFDNDLKQKSCEGSILYPSLRDRWVLKLLAPQWIKTGQYSGAIMFPPDMILAMEFLGISLRDSWSVHGGFSDLLCAENKVALRKYQSEKVPEQKIRYTGSPYCDVLVETLKQAPDAKVAFFQPMKIEVGITRILVSWPPNYHDLFPDKNEFPTYEEMTRRIFSFLQDIPNTKLTVSLHPDCGEQLVDVFDELGVNISEEYILKLIPQCDIYSTYYSSTIRWALASGKIVVNYDAYQLGLVTYDEAPGFLNTFDFSSYCDTFTRVLETNGLFENLAGQQIMNAEEWGVMDGLCTQRIFQEVEQLVSRWSEI